MADPVVAPAADSPLAPPGDGTAVERRDGRVVVVKRASGAAGRERLAREARMLGLARHPGVVELVAFTPEADHTALTTIFAGSHTLATWPDRSVEHVAGIVAALAEVVADLHHLGVVHGRIDESHVILDESGCPVLCGFAGATPSQRPADDVAALGALLHALLGNDADPGDPIPDRRWRRLPRSRAFQLRALRNLADQAGADDPTCRPGARRLSAAILAAVPDAALPTVAVTAVGARDGAGDDDSADSTDGEEGAPATHLAEQRETASVAGPPALARIRGRGVWAAVAVIGLALLTFGVMSLWHGDRPTLAASPAASCATTRCTTITTDGIVTHESHRYAVGDPGDESTVGDFACRGEAFAAVLRPRSGEVFLFDAWADAGERTAVPTASVAPQSHLVPAPIGTDDCAALTVRGPDGHLVTVPVPRSAP